MGMTSLRSIDRLLDPKDFVDIVLRSTQRKTPTLVHRRWELIRIRQFYIRKIKFTSTKWNEHFSRIVDQFPSTDEIHPFYSDLLNVLYDKQHYKIALGQIANARNLIDKIERDFIRLVNHKDTFYGCKHLKKAALGRMCSIVRMMTVSLTFLEQVRQHLSRLPTIDPNTRTFIVCGAPNVGKSTFVRKLTHADVEVHSHPFTTKTLFVGHMERYYMNWQIIDTPGLLDRPLEERNSIEMQTITAMAHLRSCSLFIIDISETCGYTLNQQAALFGSLKPLFKKKPIAIICNKIDLMRPTELTDEKTSMIIEMVTEAYQLMRNDLTSSSLGETELLLGMSTLSDEGLAQVIKSACEILLKSRVESKLKSKTLQKILQHAQSIKGSKRIANSNLFIPRTLAAQLEESHSKIRSVSRIDNQKIYSKTISNNRKCHKKSEIIPEIFAGHNILDFTNLDIARNLSKVQDEEDIMYREWNTLTKF